MRVVLSPTAKIRLRNIAEYYRDKAGARVSRKVKNRIVQRLRELPKYAAGCPIEKQLMDEGMEHRKFKVGVYGIIFRIDKGKILVSDIFDRRRDPETMHGE